jgi:hypothetical protein
MVTILGFSLFPAQILALYTLAKKADTTKRRDVD